MPAIPQPTRDGGFEPAPEQVIETADDLEVLTHPTRRRMLAYLAEQEATTGEMSEDLDLPRQQIYHHLERLIDGDLVELAREFEYGEMPVRYYRAVAERFEVRLTLPDG